MKPYILVKPNEPFVENTQTQFWNLPQIIELQNIQKENRFGSEPHLNAFNLMKAICSEIMGVQFANEYFGEYF